MPIWLRRFTFHEIHSYYQEEKEQIEKAQNGGKSTTMIDSKGNVNTPEFLNQSKTTKRPPKYK